MPLCLFPLQSYLPDRTPLPPPPNPTTQSPFVVGVLVCVISFAIIAICLCCHFTNLPVEGEAAAAGSSAPKPPSALLAGGAAVIDDAPLVSDAELAKVRARSEELKAKTAASKAGAHAGAHVGATVVTASGSKVHTSHGTGRLSITACTHPTP